MKPKVLLDTVFIVRLLSNNLFEKAMANISVFLTPEVYGEITSTPRHSYLQKLINDKRITLLDFSEDHYREKMAELIQRHRGKNQATIFRKGRLRQVHNLGEFEIMTFLQFHPDYQAMTFDKKAIKMFKKEQKIRHCVIPESDFQTVLSLSEEEMTQLWRGYR